MPIENVNSWSQFGLSGLVIDARLAYLVFLIKEHRGERQEWLQAYRDGVLIADERAQETNTVMRELVAVVRVQNDRRMAGD